MQGLAAITVTSARPSSSSSSSSSPVPATPAAPASTVSLLAAMKNDMSIIPESHEWPEKDRPKVAHNEYEAGVELPIIDLSESEEACLDKLKQACEEWGFFHLVNHDIASELLERMVNISTAFFNLPSDVKAEATDGDRKFRLYESFTRKKYTKCSWVEGLNVHDMSAIPRIAELAWPEHSKQVSQTFTDYLEEMKKLGQKILRLLVLSLGLSEREAGHLLTGCGFAGTRFNYYPPCPDPTKVLGLIPHTDPNCVTILHQDNVGGLQISKQGQWIAVKPIKNALVINIGDSFQAWSNCSYMSVEHRVVVNSNSPRASIAFFFGPVGDFVIQPPEELIDEKHPRAHRPYTYQEYMSWRIRNNLIGKNAFNIFSDPNFVPNTST